MRGVLFFAPSGEQTFVFLHRKRPASTRRRVEATRLRLREAAPFAAARRSARTGAGHAMVDPRAAVRGKPDGRTRSSPARAPARCGGAGQRTTKTQGQAPVQRQLTGGGNAPRRAAAVARSGAGRGRAGRGARPPEFADARGAGETEGPGPNAAGTNQPRRGSNTPTRARAGSARAKRRPGGRQEEGRGGERATGPPARRAAGEAERQRWQARAAPRADRQQEPRRATARLTSGGEGGRGWDELPHRARARRGAK